MNDNNKSWLWDNARALESRPYKAEMRYLKLRLCEHNPISDMASKCFIDHIEVDIMMRKVEAINKREQIRIIT